MSYDEDENKTVVIDSTGKKQFSYEHPNNPMSVKEMVDGFLKKDENKDMFLIPDTGGGSSTVGAGNQKVSLPDNVIVQGSEEWQQLSRTSEGLKKMQTGEVKVILPEEAESTTAS